MSRDKEYELVIEWRGTLEEGHSCAGVVPLGGFSKGDLVRTSSLEKTESTDDHDVTTITHTIKIEQMKGSL